MPPSHWATMSYDAKDHATFWKCAWTWLNVAESWPEFRLCTLLLCSHWIFNASIAIPHRSLLTALCGVYVRQALTAIWTIFSKFVDRSNVFIQCDWVIATNTAAALLQVYRCFCILRPTALRQGWPSEVHTRLSLRVARCYSAHTAFLPSHDLVT